MVCYKVLPQSSIYVLQEKRKISEHHKVSRCTLISHLIYNSYILKDVNCYFKLAFKKWICQRTIERSEISTLWLSPYENGSQSFFWFENLFEKIGDFGLYLQHLKSPSLVRWAGASFFVKKIDAPFSFFFLKWKTHWA